MTQFMPEQPDDSLQDFLDRKNEEPTVYYPKTERRLPSGWWILPGLLMAALLAGMFFAGRAGAATKTVTWTLPTQNTDGTVLPASQITRTTVHWGTTAAALTSAKVALAAATSTTIELPPGTWFIGARTTANGNDSALSQVVQVVIPQPTPNPPTGITVTDPTAYEIRPNSSGTLVAARVGLVPIGTKCDSLRQKKVAAATYTAVRRDAVDLINWPSTARLQDVWARCG